MINGMTSVAKTLSKSLLLTSVLVFAPLDAFAADPTPTTPDYTKPVCEGIPNDDNEACVEKLNTFCAVAANAPYKDCIEWKLVQEQAAAGNNGSPNEPEPSSGSSGGGSSSSSGGSAQTLMFSPTAFATQTSIGLLTEFFTCKNAMSDEEKALPNRLGAGLCIYVGEYCSKEVSFLGFSLCQTKKKVYCCYNSTLARIINVQGNRQLGRGMGGPQNATCKGFTLDEFTRIDLSKMDLSEFVDEITAKTQGNAGKSKAYWADRNTTRMENTWQNVDSDDMKYKILKSDDPYSAVSQPTDGKSTAQRDGRIVGSETQYNTPTAKETGVNPVNQQDLNTAKDHFSNGTN